MYTLAHVSFLSFEVYVLTAFTNTLHVLVSYSWLNILRNTSQDMLASIPFTIRIHMTILTKRIFFVIFYSSSISWFCKQYTCRLLRVSLLGAVALVHHPKNKSTASRYCSFRWKYALRDATNCRKQHKGIFKNLSEAIVQLLECVFCFICVFVFSVFSCPP